MAVTATDLLTGLGIALLLEGVVYALFPDGVKRLMVQALATPADQLRLTGLIFAALGVLFVSIAR